MFLSNLENSTEQYDAYWDDVAASVYVQDKVTEEIRSKYRRHFRRVAAVAPNSKLLDVGSGAGICVDTARREFSFDAMGIEPSPRAVELARQRFDIPVVCGLLEPHSDLPRDFGVLTLWDVIEHVEDPEALVRCCASHLTDGGILLLETPNGATFMRTFVRWLGSLGWAAIDMRSSLFYRAHRYYFTRRSMTMLLQRCGFNDVTFHAEHTMYKKELMYHKLYRMSSPLKYCAIRSVAAVTSLAPSLGNKMVVTAVKSGVRTERATVV